MSDNDELMFKAMGRHAALNAMVLVFGGPSTLQNINSLFGHDTAGAVQFMSRMHAAAGTFEFLVNPTLGKMSDSLGRKYFMLPGPISQAVMNALLAMNPNNLKILAMQGALSPAFATISGSVTGGAALSDMYQGQELAVRSGKFQANFGIGLLSGPLLEIICTSLKIGLRPLYAVKSALACLQLWHALQYLRETLTKEKRKPMSELGVSNPFGFYKLFNKTGALFKLSLASFFSWYSEGKNLASFQSQWQLNHLHFTPTQMNAFIVSFGILIFAGGQKITPALMKKYGARGFTSLAYALNTLAFFVHSMAPIDGIKTYISAMVIGIPGGNAMSATALKAAATEHAVACGMGKGEFAGLFMNLRALTVATAPLFYGEFLAWLLRKKYSGKPVWYVAAILSSILPELLHRSLGDSDMSPAPPAKQ